MDNITVRGANDAEEEQKFEPYVIGTFISLYAIIWIIGMFGNIMVLYVVIKHKKMRTTINIFIASLSVSDLAICLFAIPFTTLNALADSWVLGKFLCKLIPFVLSTSVFLSTIISMVIAIDRFVVILYPHMQKMSLKLQVIIMLATTLVSASVSLPNAIYTTLTPKEEGSSVLVCRNLMPSKTDTVYTWIVLSIQLIIPAVVLTVCYSAISIRLRKRAKLKAALKGSQQEVADSQNRKINRMLIAMVCIFIGCWLPLDVIHFFKFPNGHYQILAFLITHVLAMSSVMYNPLLYGWMNENFNLHFQQILPCLRQRKASEDLISVRETFHRNSSNNALLKTPANVTPEEKTVLLDHGNTDKDKRVNISDDHMSDAVV